MEEPFRALVLSPSWPCLGRHGGHGRLDLGGIAQIIVADRAQVIIQFVDQRLARGNVQVDDVVVRHIVQVLDQRAQAVAVGGDQHVAAGPDRRGDGLVPERQHARHGVLQALGGGQLVGRHLGVALVEARVALVVQRQRLGRDGVGAAPDQHLLVAILGGGLGLVQALQGAVMALVQAPGHADRGVHGVHRVQGDPQGADGALEQRGIGQVEGIAFFLEQFAGLAGLFAAGVGQVDVGPAGEAVFQVPLAFAVAHQNEFMHG